MAPPASPHTLGRAQAAPGSVLARGNSNAEITATLVLSEETVKTHVSRILTKLGLRDRAQLVVAAYEAGIVVPGG